MTTAREACVPEAGLPRYLGALRRNGYLARDEKGKERYYWLQFERDSALGWSWKGDEGSECEDASRRERPYPTLAPVSFRPTQQTELREKINQPEPEVPADKRFPVIEGTRAFDAWVAHDKRLGKVAPFVHSIIADGKTRRGFMRPSLFPPSGQQAESA